MSFMLSVPYHSYGFMRYSLQHQMSTSTCICRALKSPSSTLLILRYILQLGQVAQKQQRPLCPNSKMHLVIRGADEGALNQIQRRFKNQIRS